MHLTTELSIFFSGFRRRICTIPYTPDFLEFVVLFSPVSSLIDQCRARAVLLVKSIDRHPKEEMQQTRNKTAYRG
jgi:hypothetical protein